MSQIFSGCLAVKALNLSGVITSSITSMYEMFRCSYNLVGGNGTTFCSSNTTAIYAVIVSANTPGYFIQVPV